MWRKQINHMLLHEVEIFSNVLIEAPGRRYIEKIMSPSKILTSCKNNVFLWKILAVICPLGFTLIF